MDKLFIPTKIRVGFQKREDTYTKRLAYVIYYDSQGKIRKEKSFESWRDKKIEVEEYENKPHSGFVLNKGVQRYGHWNSSGRSMMRVYDDRGIEFEISINNLTFILMTTDCLKRGLEGEFVYAWYGADLILLPTGCEEYKESVEHTALQGKKLGVKDMIPGCSYRTKRSEDIIYLGRFDWFEMQRRIKGRNYSDYHEVEVKLAKRHIFYQEDSYRKFFTLSSLSSIGSINSDVPVSNYAKLMDEFNKTENSYYTTTLEEESYKFETTGKEKKNDVYSSDKWLKNGIPFLKRDDGSYLHCHIVPIKEYDPKTGKQEFKGYQLYGFHSFTMKDGALHKLHHSADGIYSGTKDMYGRSKWKMFTHEGMQKLPLVKLFSIGSGGQRGQLK